MKKRAAKKKVSKKRAPRRAPIAATTDDDLKTAERKLKAIISRIDGDENLKGIARRQVGLAIATALRANAGLL